MDVDKLDKKRYNSFNRIKKEMQGLEKENTKLRKEVGRLANIVQDMDDKFVNRRDINDVVGKIEKEINKIKRVL